MKLIDLKTEKFIRILTEAESVAYLLYMSAHPNNKAGIVSADFFGGDRDQLVIAE